MQNVLIVALILGFAGMEFATRRYQRSPCNATANDTKLELFMFVSLVAIAQPLALLGTNALCSWLMPGAARCVGRPAVVGDGRRAAGRPTT